MNSHYFLYLVLIKNGINSPPDKSPTKLKNKIKDYRFQPFPSNSVTNQPSTSKGNNLSKDNSSSFLSKYKSFLDKKTPNQKRPNSKHWKFLASNLRRLRDPEFLKLNELERGLINQIYASPPCTPSGVLKDVSYFALNEESFNDHRTASEVERDIRMNRFKPSDFDKFKHLNKPPTPKKRLNDYDYGPFIFPTVDLFTEKTQFLTTPEFDINDLDLLIENFKKTSHEIFDNDNITPISISEYLKSDFILRTKISNLKTNNPLITTTISSITKKCKPNLQIQIKIIEKIGKIKESKSKLTDYWIILINNELFIKNELENFFNRYLNAVREYFKLHQNYPENVKISTKNIHDIKQTGILYFNDSADEEFLKAKLYKKYIDFIHTLRCYYQSKIIQLI